MTGCSFRSNEYISRWFAESDAAYQRQVWGGFFGDMIRSAREMRSLSVEEASRAAGMSASEWDAVEAGTVPRTREHLHALAAGLGLEVGDMVPVVLLCRRAWDR